MAEPIADALGGLISSPGRLFLRLQLTKDVGPIRAKNLLAHFGSIDEVFKASASQLEGVNGIGPEVARSILLNRKTDALESELKLAAEADVRILSKADAEYPRNLLPIPDAPLCLYVRGTLQDSDARAVAIVGARRCSHYGREQAVRFAELLSRAGYTIVSGLARGIDVHAHQGALNAGGRTLAVLGNGLPKLYPPEHEELGRRISEKGAVLTELPIDCPPDARNFPRRNRIIVGLSLGVVVVEAGGNSGALITAGLAAEYGRKVFALPGRVDQPDWTAGTNALIRDGKAKLVLCAEDILDDLPACANHPSPSDSAIKPTAEAGHAPASNDARLSDDEKAVWNAIQEGAEDAERIAAESKLQMGKVAAAFTSLELKGMVRRLPGNRYAARSSSSAPNRT
jgi:DNA processing protein